MRVYLLTLALALALPNAAEAQQEAASHYPVTAAQQLVSGRVTLDCIIGEGGRLGCEVFEEAPLYWEFGQAALTISTEWRVSQRTLTGQSTLGGRVRRTLVFEPGPPPHIRHVRPPRRYAPTFVPSALKHSSIDFASTTASRNDAGVRFASTVCCINVKNGAQKPSSERNTIGFV